MTDPYQPIEDALRLISAPGHLILGNDKKPQYPVKDWQVPSEQLSIDAAMSAYRGWGDLVRGVAAVMGPSLLTLDFDPVEQEHIDNAAVYGISLQDIEDTRESIMDAGLSNTYAEGSHARGTHIVFRVSQSFIGRRAARLLKRCFAIDTLHGNKYCHITGKRLNDLAPAESTEPLQQLFEAIERAYPEPTVHSATGEIGVNWLPDAVVWQVLSLQRQQTFQKIANDGECDFSDAVVIAIGDLAKISNSAAQVHRMLSRTPLVTSSIRCEGGRTDRSRKFEKMFQHWWEEAQASNVAGVPLITREDTGIIPSVEHGAAVFAQIAAARQREYERNTTLAQQTFSAVKDKGTFSPAVQQSHDAIREYVPEFRCELTPPPGTAGMFVRELGQMLTSPRLEYVLPAFMFGLSMMFGRKYKDAGSPLTLFALVTGKQYTGKSRAMRALGDAINNAVAYYDADASDRTKIRRAPAEETHLRSYLAMTQFRSANELHASLLDHHGAIGIAMDEAAAGVRAMLGDDYTSVALKAYVRLLWDAGYDTGSITPQQSKQGRKDMVQLPVYNPNSPIYATCTEDELLHMSIDELINGFWSRWIVVLDERPMGDEMREPHELRKAFSHQLGHLVRKWHLEANLLDEAYLQAGTDGEGNPKLIARDKLNEISQEFIRDVRWMPDATVRIAAYHTPLSKLARLAQVDDGTVPKWFEVLVRARDMVRRVACLIALCDESSVTVEHVDWAASFVLYMQSIILTGYEDGKVAVTLDDAPAIIAEKIKVMAKGSGNVTEAELYRGCRYKLSTLTRRGESTRDIFQKQLQAMTHDRLISVSVLRLENDKYEKSYVIPNMDHVYWRRG
ncbi:hypothetical protein [Synechococcus phage Ssp-JY38]|nr:primase [Synechococcus phage Yong-L2-223]